MIHYEVASNELYYGACKELMAEQGVEGEITFPTICAFTDDHELIGFLATRPDDDMVIAGPLVMAPGKRRVFTAIQLIEQYRTAMRNMGIKRIVFSIDSENSLIKKGLERYFPEMMPYASTPNGLFYVWPIDPEVK